MDNYISDDYVLLAPWTEKPAKNTSPEDQPQRGTVRQQRPDEEKEELQESFHSYWARFQKWSIKYLSNPIEIAAEIIPEWVIAWAERPGYGHFYFPGEDASRVCVYLTLVDAATHGPLLKARLEAVFARHYLEVINWTIRDLSTAEAAEPYHYNALHKPLDNLYYQLFLTALCDPQWWQTFRDACPEWELDQYLQRFFRTHLEAYLTACQQQKEVKTECWHYLTEPFLRCGWSREALILSMQRSLGLERYTRMQKQLHCLL